MGEGPTGGGRIPRTHLSYRIRKVRPRDHRSGSDAAWSTRRFRNTPVMGFSGYCLLPTAFAAASSHNNSQPVRDFDDIHGSLGDNPFADCDGRIAEVRQANSYGRAL